MNARSLVAFAPRGFLAVAMVGLMAATSQAAVVTWGAPQNISGDTDVSTTGALVGAFNIGVSGVANTTVNGVTFNGLALSGNNVTSGNFNLAIATSFAGNNFVDSGNAPFSSLSAAYQSLLGTEAGDFTTPITLTMSGLSPGSSYQFQWWKNVSNGFQAHTTTATAGNTVGLLSNTSGGADGGIGQFAIGNFVADGSGMQTIIFEGNLQDTINGFQLRAVPEPTALALAVLGLLGVGGCRRKRE